MSVKVNPPPQVRMPSKFFNDPESRAYFEQIRTILFQLWQRTGGSFDAVAGSQIVTVIDNDVVLDTFGGLIVVNASTAPVTVELPAITNETKGETVDVAVLDATYDVTVIPSSSTTGVTIFGESSVIMNCDYMSIQYTSITESEWIAT